MPLHDTHYSFAKLLAEAGYVKIVPHSYNADTKHVSVEFAGTDDEFKAACNAVRPPKSEPTTTEIHKEVKNMNSQFSASQVVDLIREAMVAPSAQYIDRVVEKPVEKIVEKIVYKDGPSTVPTDYEQLKKDLEAARKASATWQSKYTTLYAEFEAYRAAHETVSAPATPVAPVAPVAPAATTNECPFEDAHPVSEVMYSLKPAAPATPAPVAPAPAAPEHKSFDDMFPGYEYVPFVIDENHALAHNPLYQKRGFEFTTWHEMIKSKYAHRKEYAKVIQAFDFKRVTGMINDPIHINFLANDLTGKIIAEVVAHYNDKGTRNAQDGKVYSLFTPEYLNGIVALYNRYIDAYAPAATATSAPVAPAVTDSPFDLDSFEVE